MIAGKPYYAGFGFTIEPDSIDSYIMQLRNIRNVEPLTPEQINTAKMVFYLNSEKKASEGSYTDEFSCFLLKLYNDLSEEYRRGLFESDKGTSGNNNEMTDRVIEYIKKHDIKKCAYYRHGMKFGEGFN